MPHVFQPSEPEAAPKEPASAPAPKDADHYDALEQMLNNKPRPAQPASKAEAPAPAHPAAKQVVTVTESKPRNGILGFLRSWLHR